MDFIIEILVFKISMGFKFNSTETDRCLYQLSYRSQGRKNWAQKKFRVKDKKTNFFCKLSRTEIFSVSVVPGTFFRNHGGIKFSAMRKKRKIPNHDEKKKHKSSNSNILHEHSASPTHPAHTHATPPTPQTGINFADTNKIGAEQKFPWVPLSLELKSRKLLPLFSGAFNSFQFPKTKRKNFSGGT